MSITADETTDVRDYSLLNVIPTIRGRPYLLSRVKMDACNHTTFSQAIIQSVTEVGIAFDEVIAVVVVSAATAGKHTDRSDVLSACLQSQCTYCKSGCRDFSPLQLLQSHLRYDCNDRIISVQEAKSEEPLPEVLE